MQDCSISIANALELLQSCTKPSILSNAPILDLENSIAVSRLMAVIITPSLIGIDWSVLMATCETGVSWKWSHQDWLNLTMILPKMKLLMLVCIASFDHWFTNIFNTCLVPSQHLNQCRVIIPPPNEVGGGVYWIHLVRPSVRPSVCPSVSL